MGSGNSAGLRSQAVSSRRSLTHSAQEVAERTRPMLGRDVPIVQQSAIGFGGVAGGVAGAAALVFLPQQLLKT